MRNVREKRGERDGTAKWQLNKHMHVIRMCTWQYCIK